MVAHSNGSLLSLQPETVDFCPAKALGPDLRQRLALKILAGTESVRRLAQQHEVSRKFLYQQAAKADGALQEAFSPDKADENQVLFHLPVTKHWVEQLVLGLALDCHSSQRGVVELLHDVFDYSISVGTVHNILRKAVPQAAGHNRQQDLAHVRIGAHDEIFQSGRPVLVGADVASTYCYLLSLEEHRDADTWGLRLLELQDQGFAPHATIADFGSGLRAGQALAMPETACRGDVFHAEQTVLPLATFLENRAYDAIAYGDKIERKKAKTRRRGGRTQALGRKLATARKAEKQALALAEDVGHVGRLAAPRYPFARRSRACRAGRTVRLRGRRTEGPRAALPAPHRPRRADAGQPPRRPVGVCDPTRCGLGRVGRRVPGFRGDDARGVQRRNAGCGRSRPLAARPSCADSWAAASLPWAKRLPPWPAARSAPVP